MSQFVPKNSGVLLDVVGIVHSAIGAKCKTAVNEGPLRPDDVYLKMNRCLSLCFDKFIVRIRYRTAHQFKTAQYIRPPTFHFVVDHQIVIEIMAAVCRNEHESLIPKILPEFEFVREFYAGGEIPIRDLEPIPIAVLNETSIVYLHHYERSYRPVLAIGKVQ